MEENQIIETEQKTDSKEPETVSDNSMNTVGKNEGQSPDPSNLILGKFKSVEDLTRAYKELEKHQGIQSEELGSLRQNSMLFNKLQDAWKRENETKNSEKELREIAEKYNTPEYFQDPSFKEIFKEAYMLLGKNLDTEKFINLIEGYVSSRIFAHDKKKSAEAENQSILGEMKFEKNNTSSLNPPVKRLDEMTPKELDELLDKLV